MSLQESLRALGPTRRSLAAGILCLSAAACGSEPFELASSYTLATVDGGSPPRLVAATIECDISITGGRVTFGRNETFELFLDESTDCSGGGGTPSEASYGYTGTVSLDGRRVEFHTANGGGPFSFAGQVVSGGDLAVTVPGLVALIDEVAVVYTPD